MNRLNKKQLEFVLLALWPWLKLRYKRYVINRLIYVHVFFKYLMKKRKKNLAIFQLFEVANCKRTNSSFNRLNKDNKLIGKNLKTYNYFYLVVQWVFRIVYWESLSVSAEIIRPVYLDGYYRRLFSLKSCWLYVLVNLSFSRVVFMQYNNSAV